MKRFRNSTLQACSFRSLSIVLAISLAANGAAPAALADLGKRIAPFGNDQYRSAPGFGVSPSPAITGLAPSDGFDALMGRQTFRIAAEVSTPPASQSPNTPASQPLNSGLSDKAAQENMFWESAQRSNSAADYKAYLDAFPNGLYAPLAKNRIESMSTKPEVALPALPASDQPAAPPSLKAESDAAVQPPVASGDKAAQENMFWESAQHSNLPADYQAYLFAFPNGVFAQLAKNRIASLSAGPQAGPGVPSALGPPPPVSPEALKAEVGTVETEQALDIGPSGRMELQQRLSALGLYSGPIDGDLGPGVRSAIAEWQRRHDVAPTSQLGPLQLAALRAESEAPYEQMLARPTYAPVRRIYHTYQAAPSNAAPIALGILGGLAIGLLGAKFGNKYGGKFGSFGKAGAKAGGKGEREKRK
jgi:hypothetical protein